jgi:mono/diheme cytochrome c family protein
MAPVVHNLQGVPEQEVRAIATYIASVMGQPDAERQKRSEWALARARDRASPASAAAEGEAQIGNVIYGSTCAVCHGSPERPAGSASSDALHLALSSSIALPSPNNLIRIILQGMAPPDGEAGPMMPGFAGALTDAQVASLVTYLRATYTDRPEWPNVEREVRKARGNIAQGH